MVYIAIAGCVVLTVATIIITAFVTNRIVRNKSEREVKTLQREYLDKSKKKEEVIQDANEKKESVNAADTQSSFDASIDVLHQLSQKRK
jgi:hypothetical protein